MLGLYLLGKIRLSHDSLLEPLSVGWRRLATLASGFVVYLVPGLFGAPLPLLAGYLPPQTEQGFTLASVPVPVAPASNAPAAEKPRYGVNAQPYYVLLDPNDTRYRPLVPPVAYEPDAARFAEFLSAGVQQFKPGAGVAAR